MKEYEVIKEIFSPCAANKQEFLEIQCEDPETYLRELYKADKSAQFNPFRKNGSLVIEVTCEAAQRHRYTFNEI